METTISRRLGASPRERSGRRCRTDLSCPDIFELSNGNFAIIGTDVTGELRGVLPADAGCGDGERIVEVDRETMLRARPDIPTG